MIGIEACQRLEATPHSRPVDQPNATHWLSPDVTVMGLRSPGWGDRVVATGEAARRRFAARRGTRGEAARVNIAP